MLTDKEYTNLILEQRKLIKMLKKEINNTKENWNKFDDIARTLNGEYRDIDGLERFIINTHET